MASNECFTVLPRVENVRRGKEAIPWGLEIRKAHANIFLANKGNYIPTHAICFEAERGCLSNQDCSPIDTYLGARQNMDKIGLHASYTYTQREREVSKIS